MKLPLRQRDGPSASMDSEFSSDPFAVVALAYRPKPATPSSEAIQQANVSLSAAPSTDSKRTHQGMADEEDTTEEETKSTSNIATGRRKRRRLFRRGRKGKVAKMEAFKEAVLEVGHTPEDLRSLVIALVKREAAIIGDLQFYENVQRRRSEALRFLMVLVDKKTERALKDEKLQKKCFELRMVTIHLQFLKEKIDKAEAIRRIADLRARKMVIGRWSKTGGPLSDKLLGRGLEIESKVATELLLEMRMANWNEMIEEEISKLQQYTTEVLLRCTA